MTILSGLKVVEFEGLGPGPFCGMLLADLGADVILIERSGAAAAGPAAIFKRGKRSIVLDLKDERQRDAALDIVVGADALIEGLRPGVMERLGLGPKEARARNRKLVYGRLTGWGQTGPLSAVAGSRRQLRRADGRALACGRRRGRAGSPADAGRRCRRRRALPRGGHSCRRHARARNRRRDGGRRGDRRRRGAHDEPSLLTARRWRVAGGTRAKHARRRSLLRRVRMRRRRMDQPRPSGAQVSTRSCCSGSISPTIPISPTSTTSRNGRR